MESESAEIHVRETMIVVGNGDSTPAEEIEVSVPLAETFSEKDTSIIDEMNEKIEQFASSQDHAVEKRDQSKEELELEEALKNLKKLTAIFIVPFIASMIGRKMSVYIWRWLKRVI